MFDTTGSASNSSMRVDYNPRAAQVGVMSLMEDKVFDAEGMYQGRIEEMILDTHTGCIRYVVVAFGGFLGIGRKRFAVPWSALTPDLKYQRCVLNVIKMKLMAVPVFDDDPWLRRTDPTRGLANPFPLR